MEKYIIIDRSEKEALEAKIANLEKIKNPVIKFTIDIRDNAFFQKQPLYLVFQVYEDSNISTENFKFLHKLARLLKRLETRANDIYMSSIEALKSSQEKELNRIKEMSYWEFLKWRKK